MLQFLEIEDPATVKQLRIETSDDISYDIAMRLSGRHFERAAKYIE